MNQDVFIHTDTEFKYDLNILGDHIAIDKGVYCTAKVTLHDYIHIAPYVTIIGGTEGTLKCHGFNNIMAGARVICSSDRFDDSGIFGCLIPKKYKGTEKFEPVVMEKFSNIGTNAIVLPGSILREGVLVTAGSLLMGDTVPWGVYKGNPAKLVKIIDNSKIKQFEKELMGK